MSKPSIGIFDSGLGGLTVVRALMHRLPNESILYLGDTARVPYGGKSPETILRYALENALFLIARGVKIIVIACNTASAHATDYLASIFRIPVIGVIIPGAESALAHSKSQRIGVIATRSTVNSGRYEETLRARNPQVQVWTQACPLFASIVEEGYSQHPAVRPFIAEALAPLLQKNIDTLLLACTHYPLLRAAIQEIVGADITLVDSADSCAKKVESTLKELGGHKHLSGQPEHHFFVTDDPERFREHGAAFLGQDIPHVQRCSLSFA